MRTARQFASKFKLNSVLLVNVLVKVMKKVGLAGECTGECAGEGNEEGSPVRDGEAGAVLEVGTDGALHASNNSGQPRCARRTVCAVSLVGKVKHSIKWT